jgi:chaperonin cofactor prefoldin
LRGVRNLDHGFRAWVFSLTAVHWRGVGDTSLIGVPGGILSGEVTEEEEEGEEKPTKFVPKLSVNVRNKEVAIPAKYASLMTDEKSQKEVHELFEKSLGLDVIKPKHQELMGQFEQTRKNLEAVTGSVQAARTDYQSAMTHFKQGRTVDAMNSLDNFFDKLKVPEEVVLRYALEKAKFHELPPEQQQMLRERKQAESKAQNFEATAQTTEQRLAESQTKLLDLELGSALAKPETKAIVEYFDGLEGQEAGSFRQLVIDYGIEQHHKGRDLSPEEAAQGVIKRLGLASLAKARGQSQPTGQQSVELDEEEVEGEPEAEVPPPKVVKKRVVNTGTLPNVGGKGTSPTKAPIKSLKQLKAFANDF